MSSQQALVFFVACVVGGLIGYVLFGPNKKCIKELPELVDESDQDNEPRQMPADLWNYIWHGDQVIDVSIPYTPQPRAVPQQDAHTHIFKEPEHTLPDWCYEMMSNEPDIEPEPILPEWVTDAMNTEPEWGPEVDERIAHSHGTDKEAEEHGDKFADEIEENLFNNN